MLELPDWGYWGRLKSVTLRDALVLSAGLCPHKYNHENTNEIELEYAQKYWDNLQIHVDHYQVTMNRRLGYFNGVSHRPDRVIFPSLIPGIHGQAYKVCVQECWLGSN